MAMLVITVIAIGLFAFAMMAGVNHLNTNAFSINSTSSAIVTQFSLAGSAVDRYRLLYGRYPSSIAELSPRFLAPASAIPSMIWSIGAGGRWVCLSGAVSESEYSSLTRASTKIPPSLYYVSNTCGAVSNIPAPTEFPASVSATMWLQK